ncbi:MAG: hypothetical protein COA58_10705 [Bacteroidetes bacterium]|nr:MAG: hypothetical protein COA58_10705 [Bacteroidota bacterium]
MEILIENIDALMGFLTSLVVVAVVILVLKRFAGRLGLVDKPNARKVHAKPVPVVGGLAIGITFIMSLLLSSAFLEAASRHIVVISASMFLMIVGILDDKLNLKASHRLLLQFLCGYAIVSSGIRLTSLYGVFGVGELNTIVSYVLSIFLIVGVVNAFNLIDGIDGLAGFLSLIGFGIFSYISFRLNDFTLLIILVALMGSICGFLAYNLSKNKIFLGDGGSLFLGFMMVSIGLQLIEQSKVATDIEVGNTVSVVFGVFLIPVLDSLRVYWGRMQRGFSPFRADKSHIHHLFLFFKISHKRATMSIVLSASILIALLVVLCRSYGLSSAIFTVSILFLCVTAILSGVQKLGEWRKKITELENRC